MGLSRDSVRNPSVKAMRDQPLRQRIVQIAHERSFTGNPYDGHTLAEQLEQVGILTEDVARKPRQVIIDPGFRGVVADNSGVEIIHRDKLESLTALQRRWLKRRQAVEPASDT